jgi:tyrosinase
MKVVMRPNQSAVGTHYDFVRAVLNLKAAKSERGEPNITNLYDEFVVDHLRTVHIQPDRSDLNDAHNGPAFFPWHRQFLINFEQALQKVSGNPLLGLPYWDWSVDRSPNSSIWGSSGFLGGNGDPGNNYQVPSGPFAFKSG